MNAKGLCRTLRRCLANDRGCATKWASWQVRESEFRLRCGSFVITEEFIICDANNIGVWNTGRKFEVLIGKEETRRNGFRYLENELGNQVT